MFKIIKIILVTSIILFESSNGIAEEEKIKIVLIDFKNKPKSAYFSVAKCIRF